MLLFTEGLNIMNQNKTTKSGNESDKISVVTEKTDGRGKHPNSVSNLKPWDKGISGNPQGRPHKYVKLKKALDKFGSMKKDVWQLGENHGQDNYKNEVLERIWYEASTGSIQHIKILAELGCLDDES